MGTKMMLRGLRRACESHESLLSSFPRRRESTHQRRAEKRRSRSHELRPHGNAGGWLETIKGGTFCSLSLCEMVAACPVPRYGGEDEYAPARARSSEDPRTPPPTSAPSFHALVRRRQPA